MENTTTSELNLRILVWDNTPGGQDAGDISKEIHYIAAPDNPGLARAYNYALELAHAEGFDWLLTLDQDSVLPEFFLTRIANLAHGLNSKTKIGAIVPQVTDGGRNLSPFQFMFGAIPRWFNFGFVGIPERATYALNSGAMLRVATLRQIGGYNALFPLDVSDINLFYHLHRSGNRVFVAGDLLVHHEFSLLKKHGRMSTERYHAQLLDECAFWDMNMGPIARGERMVRLAVRFLKDSYSKQNAVFRRLTLSELIRRLLTPRKKRIVEWINWATARCQCSSLESDVVKHVTSERQILPGSSAPPQGSGQLHIGSSTDDGASHPGNTY